MSSFKTRTTGADCLSLVPCPLPVLFWFHSLQQLHVIIFSFLVFKLWQNSSQLSIICAGPSPVAPCELWISTFCPPGYVSFHVWISVVFPCLDYYILINPLLLSHVSSAFSSFGGSGSCSLVSVSVHRSLLLPLGSLVALPYCFMGKVNLPGPTHLHVTPEEDRTSWPLITAATPSRGPGLPRLRTVGSQSQSTSVQRRNQWFIASLVCLVSVQPVRSTFLPGFCKPLHRLSLS